MCGIIGLAHYQNARSIAEKMLKAIVHRGPDAGEIYTAPEGQVTLGHRRLSIIDLSSAANQPFRKEGWVIVFNGEIYNYRELAKTLTSLDVRLQTTSDTEVLLEAWRHWGPECLNKLRGMFAFAIYEESTQKLFIARDPYGIKPFFYYHHNEQFAFASELKALLAAIPQPRLNEAALVASLLYVWIPDSLCAVQQVQKLPAGFWGMFDGKNLRLERYYHYDALLNLAETHPIGVHELEKVLLDSVSHHLIADVPVATFLSGGLDSSLITAMATTVNKNIEAYTIAFREQDKRFEAMPDDASYAAIVAKKLAIKLNRIEISPNIVEMLPKIVHTLDEPIGDAAAINTFLICQAARDNGIKVLLSGMGADELFAGYRRHYATLLSQKIQTYMPAWFRHSANRVIDLLPVASESGGYKLLRWLKRFAGFMNLPEEAAYRQSYTYYNPITLKNMLAPHLAPCVDSLIEEHAAIYWSGPKDIINRMCYTDIHLFMLGLNLTYTDRASMAASTEVRVPFIDREVVQASFAIPGSQKLHGKTSKYILKQVAERWLPQEIIYRPKAGFSAPLRSWIRHDLRELVDELVLGPHGLVSRNFLKKEPLEHMIKLDRQGKMDYSQHIWQLLTLEQWLREMKLCDNSYKI